MLSITDSPPNTPPAEPRRLIWLALPILLAALGLRLYSLSEQNIWWDEGLAFWAVSKDLAGTTAWTAGDVHPPVFFWLLWWQVRLVGESTFSARLVDVFTGLLTVAFAFPAGRLLAGKWAGLAAMLLLAIARFPVWWSQELRMYAPVTLFTFAATYFLLRGLAGRPRWWIGYLVSAVLTLWTVYLGAAVLLAHNISVALVVASRLLFRPNEASADRNPLTGSQWRLLGVWTALQIATLLLFLPWAFYSKDRMQTWSTSEPVEPWLFVRLMLVTVASGISTDIDAHWPKVAGGIIALAAGGIVAALVTRRGTGEAAELGATAGPSGWLLIATVIAVPAAFVFYVTQPRPLFYSPRLEVRYFLMIAPACAVLAGAALAAIGRANRVLGVAATVAVAAPLLLTTADYLDARHHRDEYDTIVQTINAYAKPDDGVVLVSGDRSVVFLYYFLPGVRAKPAWYALPYTVPATPPSAAGDVGPIADKHRRIWLVSAEAHLQDPAKQIAAWLDGNRPKVLDVPIGHNRVALYDRDRETPEVLNRSTTFSLGAPSVLGSVPTRFTGFDLPATRLFPGETGHLSLNRFGSADGITSIRMLDANGVALEEWVLTDRADAKSAQLLRDTVEFRAYRYTPAGRYRFEVGDRNAMLPLPGAAVSVERTDPPPSIVPGRPYQPGRAFGPEMELVGYEVNRNREPLSAGARVKPGDELQVALYWNATTRLDRSWVQFVHLLGSAVHPVSNNQLWGQADGFPLQGEFPTHQWRPGTVIRDDRAFRVDPNAPAGTYEVEAGFYWPANGDRMNTHDGTGRVILQTVVVER